MHLVARTGADVRDVMIEGESGLLSISHPKFKPKWYPSRRHIEWPNGCVAETFSADEPDSLRGPQCEAAWADEVASWKYAEAWDQLMFGLRIGRNPQCVATTTPRPTKLIKAIMNSPGTVMTHGSTYENRANLAPSFFSMIIKRYEGTRLGRQELKGELLEDNPGALWSLSRIDELRVNEMPQLMRIVVAIDPAASSKRKGTSDPAAFRQKDKDESDENGIIAAGRGYDGHAYILDDVSMIASPHEWGAAAVKCYKQWSGDRIIGEVNNGGEMVEYVIRTVDSGVPFKEVHASRGKAVRAEPIAALYEQGKVHHVGTFTQLEDQMTEWDPLISTDSPDRVDALVWALTELMFPEATGLLEFYQAASTDVEARKEAEKKKSKRGRMSEAEYQEIYGQEV